MKLTADIRKAADGRLDLHVVELPDLEAHARSVEDIPDAFRDAATQLTGGPRDDFDVDVSY